MTTFEVWLAAICIAVSNGASVCLAILYSYARRDYLAMKVTLTTAMEDEQDASSECHKLRRKIRSLTEDRDRATKMAKYATKESDYIRNHIGVAVETLIRIRNRETALNNAVDRYLNWKPPEEEDPDHYVKLIEMERAKHPMTVKELNTLEEEYEGV